MHRYPPEDAHGASHYYYRVIISKSLEPFCPKLGYLKPMTNYWHKPIRVCNTSVNKYLTRLC